MAANPIDKALAEFIGDKQKASRVAAVLRILDEVFAPHPGEQSRAYVLVISVESRTEILTCTNVSSEFATAILEEASEPSRIEQITTDAPPGPRAS